MRTRTDRRPGTVRDPGLQAERTTLAWSRTALALAGASLLAARALAAVVGVAAAVPAVAGGLAALAVVVAARRRYRRWTAAGRTERPGVSNAALACVATLLGAAALAACLTANL
ncbi:DUF202 domain-containing protein [Dactylosporangium sp. CA-139066]|uniref:DUF202 domain-containing protein n=1 Tax=Dactylosporangium sp. CA-139066 TaxID=3239930 RepID=UPI003D92FEB3